MAMGDATDRLGSINPSDLIGRAVVEPRAVENLANAFRSGFITADDIIQRSGESAQLKQKAEVQLLSEQVSPEAIAARAAQRDAAAAQAGLQSATAAAQTPLAAPAGQLAATQLEEQAAVQKYGPGVEYFKTLAPEAGVAAPVTAEGQPDYAKRAQLGLQLFEWKQTRERAKERLTPAHWEKSPNGNQLFKFNKGGELITPQLEQSLATQAVSGFAQVAPGTTATASTSAPAAQPTIAITPAQRAQAVEQFGIAPEQAAVMTSMPVVEPRVSTPTDAPEVLLPGATTFLGPAKAKDAPDKFLPSQGVEDLNRSRQVVDAVTRLKQRYEDLVASEPNLVGFLQGRLATWAKSKEWNQKVAAFQRDATASLAPLAKGVYGETGVLSDKDIARYEGVLPSLRDTPQIGNAKLQELFKETQFALTNKLDSWQRAGYDVSGFQDLMITPDSPAASATGVVKTGPGWSAVREIKGIGKGQLGPDGLFYRVP